MKQEMCKYVGHILSAENNSDIKLCQNTLIEKIWNIFYVDSSARHIMS